MPDCGVGTRIGSRSVRVGTSGHIRGATHALRAHPELQCLIRGCAALISQKEDKIDQNRVSFGSKCENVPSDIKADPKQRPCVVISHEKSI